MFYHLLRNRVLLLQSSHLQIVLLPSRPSKSKWISRERHQDFTHFHGPGDSKWPLYPPIVGAHFTFERVTKTSPKGHVRRIATERSLFCQEHDLMDQRIIFCRVWHLSFFSSFTTRFWWEGKSWKWSTWNYYKVGPKTSYRLDSDFIYRAFFPPVTSFYKVNYFRAFMTPIV